MTKRRAPAFTQQMELGFGVPEAASSDGCLADLGRFTAVLVAQAMKDDPRDRFALAADVSRLMDEDVRRSSAPSPPTRTPHRAFSRINDPADVPCFKLVEHMTNTLLILGLDPGLRRTGWGVVACTGARLAHVAHGVASAPDAGTLADRLLSLLDQLDAIVAEHGPHEAAVEEVFVNVNPASTLKLGQARACALLAPARAGVPVSEYATRLVKKAVVGTGGADKTQVAFMVRRLLPTAGEVTADAADALAVAITHAHLRLARMRGAA